ncbi:MAG TPA: DMT family transporter [Oligoflexus sp.]|uniref:DMT family transporter n=1 Tax=Oligoflexus sp. TaxID=1971216 RepID=UPI002D72E630|nr:DMT family transporter [Oligoflexus sp.]HYX39533.1 DMT family transporter [Oligoflexus sp.]
MDIKADRPFRAFFYMLLAQLSFSSNILLIRMSERGESMASGQAFKLTPWEPMLLRSLALSLLCMALLRKYPAEKLAPQENLWIWARGTAGVMSLTAYYYGVLHIPLGMASLFSNSSPLYVTMLALFLGHEAVTRTRGVALLVGFAGVALVGLGIRSGSGHAIEVGDVLIAMLSGPLSAAAYFSIRMLKRVRNEQIMLSLGLAGTILSAVMLLIQGEHFPITRMGWIWLIASILPAMAAQLCLTMAFRLAPATQVAPLQYSAPLFSGVLAYFFLQETIPPVSLLGMAVVIIFGLALPYWEAGRLHRQS